MANFRFPTGPVWSLKTKRFRVSLYVERIHRYKYDGDDEGGETQEAIDNGDLVAFSSHVVVELDGEEIARDSLYGSVYQSENVPDFWQDHRSADPMNRNCTIYRAKHGENSCIGHYFPDMVKTAISEARDYLRTLRPVPYVRESAA